MNPLDHLSLSVNRIIKFLLINNIIIIIPVMQPYLQTQQVRRSPPTACEPRLLAQFTLIIEN